MSEKPKNELKLIKLLYDDDFKTLYLIKREGIPGFLFKKRINVNYYTQNDCLKPALEEIYLTKKINHPNVLKIIEINKSSNNQYLYIEMEYCNGGSLEECLKKYMELYNHPFTEEIIQHLMKQIITALEECNSNNILHGNLNINNILVNFESEQDKKSLNMLKATIKIKNFGILKQSIKTVCIGPYDTQKTKQYESPANDILNMGIICYQMLMGRGLANKINKNKNFCAKLDIDIGTYSLPIFISQELVLFIKAIFQKKSYTKFFYKYLLQHDFLTENIKKFNKLNINAIPGLIEQKGAFIFISDE